MPRNRNPGSYRKQMVVKFTTENIHLQQFHCPIVEDFDFGTAIQELYPILSNIFKFLSFKDLKNAAEVNSIWDEYANKELSKRRHLGKFNIFKSSEGFELCKNSTFDDTPIRYGLIFGNVQLKEFRSIKFQSNKDNDSDTVLNGLRDKVFGPNTIVFGYLIGIFPPGKKEIVCTGLGFPKIPSLIIKEYSGTNFITSISQAFEESFQLKALICLCDERSTCYERSLTINLKYLLDKQKDKKFALAGGLITARMEDFFNVAHNKIRAVKRGFHHAIAFLSPKGDNSFEGYSIVVENEDSFGGKLAEAKANMVLKKHSTAILFQCSGIHIPFLEEEFRYHFPTVDFTCVTVEGEIGWDSYVINGECDTIPKKRQKVEPTYIHAYSLVVLFLSWD